MTRIGTINLFDTSYTHYYQKKDPVTGKSAQTGNLYFGFNKIQKLSDGTTKNIKYSEMNPLEVKTGKAVSKLMYWAKGQKPGFIASIATLALGFGFILYAGIKDKIQNDNAVNEPVAEKVANVPNDVYAEDYPLEEENTYVVQNGDNIWNISKNLLQGIGVENPSNAMINDLKNETISRNPGLKDNGNLIHPGDTLMLPSL